MKKGGINIDNAGTAVIPRPYKLVIEMIKLYSPIFLKC